MGKRERMGERRKGERRDRREKEVRGQNESERYFLYHNMKTTVSQYHLSTLKP